MRDLRVLSTILVCAAALGGTSSLAKEALKTETRFFFESPSNATVIVRKGEPVLEAVLRPKRLLELQADARSLETGELILGAGAQLIPQNVLDGGVNFCTTRPARGNLLTGETMLCFPNDGDLLFDEYFWTISALKSGVATGYFVPANKKKLQRTEAKEVPSTAFERNLTFRIVWVGGDGTKKPIQLEGQFCVDGICDWRTRRFTSSAHLGDDDLPFAVSCVRTEQDQAQCQLSWHSQDDFLAVDVRGVRLAKGKVF